MRKTFTLFLAISAGLLQSCYLINTDSSMQNTVVEGYKPVYGSSEGGEIKFVDSRTITNPGKIYLYNKYLLINEINQGIHVYNNADPENPLAVGFIQLVGNSDMAVKNDVLYADHMGNIVTINIQDFNTLTQQASLPLRNWNFGIPPPSGFYFECVQTEKGVVVDWKKTEIKNPSCYANF
ncbi:MAG TPA: hypothetical protein PLJ60_06240 [Chryseolinea sp.]|nr:hypothetical protein [Chryseolinea sp.]HPM29917.1 hypothetical protein [Chryseolinea sp.]